MAFPHLGGPDTNRRHICANMPKLEIKCGQLLLQAGSPARLLDSGRHPLTTTLAHPR